MNSKRHRLLIGAWVADSIRNGLASEFPEVEVVVRSGGTISDADMASATIFYGTPAVSALNKAERLEWIQLNSAGVPIELCDALRDRTVHLTNLSGLYGPTIAEHALALMLALARQLPVAWAQQQQRLWQRDLADRIFDLHGKTLAVVGLGDIGRSIARLGRAMGMRVVGCRRTMRFTPDVDQVYDCRDLAAMFRETNVVAVAAPWTRLTEGMIGERELNSLPPGSLLVNISRGQVVQEEAMIGALVSGRLAGAGLDAFCTEPLPPDHRLWTMPQVIVSPHYSGETVNRSARPGRRLIDNLRRFLDRRPMLGTVDVTLGY